MEMLSRFRLYVLEIGDQSVVSLDLIHIVKVLSSLILLLEVASIPVSVIQPFAPLFQPQYVDGLLNPSHRILSFTTEASLVHTHGQGSKARNPF